MIFKRSKLVNMIRENKKKIDETSTKIKSIFQARIYKKYINNTDLKKDVNISFTLSSDGVSFFSNGRSIWPTFLSINEIPIFERFKFKNILIPIIYYGKNPPSVDIVLNPLIKELNSLYNGFICNGIFVKCYLYGLIFDLPARAKYLCMRSYTGFFCCSDYYDKGSYLIEHKKMYFPFDHNDIEANHSPRRYNDTKNILMNIQNGEMGKFGILNVSPFFYLNYFSPFENNIIDIMHCIFINISKNMLNLMFDSSNSKKDSYIRPYDQKQLSSILANQKLPDTFLRKIKYVNIKCTQFGLFI